MPNTTGISHKKNLRKQLRQARKNLPKSHQKKASKRILINLKRLPSYRFAKRVALYLEADGEVPTYRIIEDLHLRNRAVFVPLIDPVRPHSLRFVRIDKTSQLKRNRFGILEPKFDYQKTVPIFSISMLLTPLVGFNEKAQRLGMGGGFYDRALAKAAKINPAVTVGLAYECQKYEHLPQAPWDIPLNYIATEETLYPSSS